MPRHSPRYAYASRGKNKKIKRQPVSQMLVERKADVTGKQMQLVADVNSTVLSTL